MRNLGLNWFIILSKMPTPHLKNAVIKLVSKSGERAHWLIWSMGSGCSYNNKLKLPTWTDQLPLSLYRGRQYINHCHTF